MLVALVTYRYNIDSSDRHIHISKHTQNWTLVEKNVQEVYDKLLNSINQNDE